MRVIQLLNSEIWFSVELDFQYLKNSTMKSVCVYAEWSSENGWHLLDDNFLNDLSEEHREEFYTQLDEVPIPSIERYYYGRP